MSQNINCAIQLEKTNKSLKSSLLNPKEENQTFPLPCWKEYFKRYKRISITTENPLIKYFYDNAAKEYKLSLEAFSLKSENKELKKRIHKSLLYLGIINRLLVSEVISEMKDLKSSNILMKS